MNSKIWARPLCLPLISYDQQFCQRIITIAPSSQGDTMWVTLNSENISDNGNGDNHDGEDCEGGVSLACCLLP